MSKFRNRPYNSRDGKSFQSTLEGQRWEELLLMEQAGEIKDLQRQVPFRLHAVRTDGERVFIGKYVADFVYTTRFGKKIVEETKGFWTQLARWKWKHVQAEYGGEYDFKVTYRRS